MYVTIIDATNQPTNRYNASIMHPMMQSRKLVLCVYATIGVSVGATTGATLIIVSVVSLTALFAYLRTILHVIS